MQGKNKVKLGELICRRHFRLERAFSAEDTEKTGMLSVAKWAEVLGATLQVQGIEWTNVGLEIPQENGQVMYLDFLNKYSFQTMPSIEKMAAEAASADVAGAARALYANFDMMSAVFETWDTNKDGG